MLLSPERPNRTATRYSTTPGTFSGFSSPLPLIVFFRGVASLSSLSSELSGARLHQLYRRPRERFAVDNRNRLQTFRMAPATISTFSISCISLAISSFRALFHRRRQTIQAPDVDSAATTTKSSAKLLSAWQTGHRAFLMSEVARRLLYDRRTMARTTKMTKILFSSCKTSWFYRNLSSFPIPTLVLSATFFHFRFLSFICDFAASVPLDYICKCVRVKAQIWWTTCVWTTSYRRRWTPSFLLFSFTMFCVLFLSLSLSFFPSFRQCIQHISLDAHRVFFIVTFGFISTAMRS